jgi:CubicO group peptidase (beta-lactamase class C family)
MVTGDPIGSAMEAAVEEGVFPGAVLAVRYRGTTVCEKAVGRLSTMPSGAAVTKDTVYDLASLTKPLATSTALLLLAQRNQADLEKPIESTLVELRGTALGAASPVHLLTHSSGLPGWRPFHERLEQEGVVQKGRADRERVKATILKYIQAETLVYPLGTQSLYSDLGFILLGFMIEQI